MPIFFSGVEIENNPPQTFGNTFQAEKNGKPLLDSRVLDKASLLQYFSKNLNTFTYNNMIKTYWFKTKTTFSKFSI